MPITRNEFETGHKKLTFGYFLRESAKTKGFDYDTFNRSSQLIIIIVLGPVYLAGKYILRKGGDIEQNQTRQDY